MIGMPASLFSLAIMGRKAWDLMIATHRCGDYENMMRYNKDWQYFNDQIRDGKYQK